MDGKDIILLILGGILGFIFGLTGNVVMLMAQFSSSIAAYRVNGVTDATRQITSANERGEYTGVLTDRYRYSLGVLIDEFTKQCFKETFMAGHTLDEAIWPCLVDYDSRRPTSAEKMAGVDRWARFERYVRPVVNDINDFALLYFVGQMVDPFRFLGISRRCLSLVRLQALGKLCREIETTVGLLDGAFEKGVVYLSEANHVTPVNLDDMCFVDQNTKTQHRAHQESLFDSYRQLSLAWVAWRELTDPQA